MAKFAAIATILFFFFFCLFTFSSARKNPETDDTKVRTTTFRLPNHPVKPGTDLTVSFIPINRRFNDRSRFHRFQPRFLSKEHVEISYGNDMLVSTDKTKTTDLQMPDGGKRRWMKLHHHQHGEDSDDESESNQIKRFVFRRHDFDRFGRDEKLNLLKKIKKHTRR